MTNYLINNLASTLSKGKINKKEGGKILSLLDPSDLRKLLYRMRLEDEKNTVDVILSDDPNHEVKKSLLTNFPGANLRININKNIGAGVMIKHYDMIYDLTVKAKLENLVRNLEDNL
jgi:hypothetical protein